MRFHKAYILRRVEFALIFRMDIGVFWTELVDIKVKIYLFLVVFRYRYSLAEIVRYSDRAATGALQSNSMNDNRNECSMRLS